MFPLLQCVSSGELETDCVGSHCEYYLLSERTRAVRVQAKAQGISDFFDSVNFLWETSNSRSQDQAPSSNFPIQGNVLYRHFKSSTPQVELLGDYVERKKIGDPSLIYRFNNPRRLSSFFSLKIYMLFESQHKSHLPKESSLRQLCFSFLYLNPIT